MVPPLAQVGHVRHDEVDAEHLLVGEHQAAVDDHDLVPVLEDVHVLADLADPAERDDAQRRAAAVDRCDGGPGDRRRPCPARRRGHAWRDLPSCCDRPSEEPHLVGVEGVGSVGRRGGDGGQFGRADLRRLRAPRLHPWRRRAATGWAAGTAGLVRAARRERLSMSTWGSMAMSSKSVSRNAAWRNAAAGWYMANAEASGAPVAGSTGRAVPWAAPMRAPGMNVPREKRPRVTTTAGSSTASCRPGTGRRRPSRPARGSRLPGGRHLTTFVMKTSSRRQPIERSRSVRRPPAAPDERPPLLVLVLPGPSPTKTTSVSALPSPGTARVRPRREPAARAAPDLVVDGRQGCASLVARHAARPARRDAGASHPRAATSSAIWTAFVAAPLRRLSLTTQKARPRPSGTDTSRRTRPTKIWSFPAASVASG